MTEKIIFISHPYYAINNSSNNLRIYKKSKNSNNWYYIQCKSIEEYRTKLRKYILGFYEYTRDEKKAHYTLNDVLKKNDDNSSMFDYFMGGKKSEEVMQNNKMFREKMAMLKDASYLTDNKVKKMQQDWCKYIENSNIQLSVLSFNQKYIDENTNIKDFQKIITTDVLPKFFGYCGYENPKENLEWIVALHNDRDNNYHFHIAWIEKKACYENSRGNLGYRQKLLLKQDEEIFLKRQVGLAIERKKLYTPKIIDLNQNLNALKSYFNKNDHNFTLKNMNEYHMENDMVELGFYLNKLRTENRKYIKYGSIKDDELGVHIKKLAKGIKSKIFQNPEIKKIKNDIDKSINNINDLIESFDEKNSVNKEFSPYKNSLIDSKLDSTDKYIMNSIINYANTYFRKNSKYKIEDLISEISYQEFRKKYLKYENKPIIRYKISLIKNVLDENKIKSQVEKALIRITKKQEQVADKFYEMFERN